MKTLKTKDTMLLARFARLLEYERAGNKEFRRIVKFLEREGVIRRYQGGFLGHSTCHPKRITVLKPFAIDAFKKIVLSRTNYTIGEFTVHKTKQKRKCESCRHAIGYGERYGVKLQLGRRNPWKKGRATVISQEIVCLPCLLEKAGMEGFEIYIY